MTAVTQQDDGFFARWSRRKAQLKAAPAEEAAGPTPMPAVAVQPTGAVQAPMPTAAEAPPPPPPTLADVAALTGDSDFSRFVAPGVADDVKRAAIKKLFSDPHFNVMDGLDTYIADYNQPDPIPPAMLRQLMQSKFLGLFEDEAAAGEKQAKQLSSIDAADPAALTGVPLDENADLQLQPHDAAGRPGAGESTDSGPADDGSPARR